MTFREAFGNTWGKILVVLFPTLVAGFIVVVTMREKISHLEADVREAQRAHVTRVELQGQLEAILREIAGLREDVRDLRRPR